MKNYKIQATHIIDNDPQTYKKFIFYYSTHEPIETCYYYFFNIINTNYQFSKIDLNNDPNFNLLITTF
jgi:hypothetical protein